MKKIEDIKNPYSFAKSKTNKQEIKIFLGSDIKKIDNIDQLKKGDHIVSETKFRFPKVLHHGIYIGGGEIIHFDGHGKQIALCNSLLDFSKRQIFKLDYQLNPILTPDRKGEDDVVRVAKELLETEIFGKKNTTLDNGEELITGYHVGKKNCEHLAWFCRTGIWSSPQIENISIKINYFYAIIFISILVSIVCIAYKIDGMIQKFLFEKDWQLIIGIPLLFPPFSLILLMGHLEK